MNTNICKVSYINFWNDPCNDKYFNDFITNNFNCKVINVNEKQNPDILIASVFGNINKIDNINARCKIFFYGENLDTYPPYNNIDLLKSKFDIIAGFKFTDKKNKIFRFPLWLIYYPFYNFKNESNIIDYIENKYDENIKKNKTIFATLISRHDRGGQRKKIYNVLSDYGEVCCPGIFNHNTKSIGSSQIDKIKYVSNSMFNICPENSVFEGYTTEKIFQAFEAGTIPIYWGYDLPEKEILNQNKYCFCNMNDINILKQQIKDVVLNRRIYIEGKIFNEHAKDIVEIYYEDLVNEIKKYFHVNY